MLKTHNVRFAYPSESELIYPDIVVNNGEVALLLGNSGTGKSTLLNLIIGLQNNYSGDIFLENTNVNDWTEKQKDRYRGENIGFISQMPHFLSFLTMKENIEIAVHLANKKQKTDWMKYCNELGISALLNKKPEQLSAGELQRFSIVRAIANSPKLIIADEPTSALDNKNFEVLSSILMKLKAELNIAILIVTHDSRWLGKTDKTYQL